MRFSAVTLGKNLEYIKCKVGKVFHKFAKD